MLRSPMLALTSALLGLACGSAERPESAASERAAQPGATAPAVDPCSLLTDEEIAASMGWNPAQTEPSGAAATATCNYYGAATPAQMVSLTISPGIPAMASSEEMAAWRRQQTRSYGDVKFVIEPVEGLGVPAIRNDLEGGSAATVEAAANGRLLIVVTSRPEASRALAIKAIARLP